MSAVVRIIAPLAVMALLVTTVHAQDQEKATAYAGFGLKPAEGGQGFEITMVQADSPAEKGGFKVGDVIVKLNGMDVSQDLLVKHVKKGKPGDSVTFTVKRDGKEQEIKVKLGEPKQP